MIPQKTCNHLIGWCQFFVCLLVLGCLLTLSSPVQAFEDTQVLPQGVRRLKITTVHTGFSQTTNAQGQSVGLAHSLEKNMSFADFLKTRQGLAKKQLQSLMMSQGIAASTVLGTLQADATAAVNVYAPSFAYGITPRLTIGFGIPYYFAQSQMNFNFVANDQAREFVNMLALRAGSPTKAEEARAALNQVPSLLQQTLTLNGYRPLGNWSGEGFGDAVLKAKYRGRQAGSLSTALEVGVVAPTGKTDDPDNFNDIAFGDGTWDVLSGVFIDQRLTSYAFVNVFGRYTAQLPAKREMRLVRDDEFIEVDKEVARYKLGDKIDAGLSFQTTGRSTLQAGLGYLFHHKGPDTYYSSDERANAHLSKDTLERAHILESKLGYSSIADFEQKKAKAPYNLMLSYQYQMQSRNMPISHLLMIDASIYF